MTNDLQAARERYAKETDNLQRRAVRAMVRAFLELNTIRARDGVPLTRYGPSSVTEEYFSSVVDELNAVVIAMTGHSAHCHPELYKHD